MSGKIILVNGASSSGKSTICRALQTRLEEPFWHFSIDHLRDAKVLPMERIHFPAQHIKPGDFEWSTMRPAFFQGFHRCIPALAEAGNNLVVEHVIEKQSWMRFLVTLLKPFDVFFVGVHCPLEELDRRELERGDRTPGEASRDFQTVHSFGPYDCEVDSTKPLNESVEHVLAAWSTRRSPSEFAKRGALEGGH